MHAQLNIFFREYVQMIAIQIWAVILRSNWHE